jgi:ATPase subunit of ABC transporter with duplicated ATPase domains
VLSCAGNYDAFVKTVAENEVVQMKKYQKEQEDIKHIKEFIASCGECKRGCSEAFHGKLVHTARQAGT